MRALAYCRLSVGKWQATRWARKVDVLGSSSRQHVSCRVTVSHSAAIFSPVSICLMTLMSMMIAISPIDGRLSIFGPAEMRPTRTETETPTNIQPGG